MEEKLIEFLIELNDKGLINNHDFDYEKEAKNFANKFCQPLVVGRSEQLCQCEDAPIKHFINNWCEDCQKHIV